MRGDIDSRLVSSRIFFSGPDSFITMSQEFIQTPHQSRRKCRNCGLVNASSDELCRRCGTPLADEQHVDTGEPIAGATPKKRSLLKRITWVLATTLIILGIWYVSLLLSSDGLQPDQREKVQQAIAVLQQQGFNREAFILKHLVVFRGTDNWWNRYVGHRDAYAATNFPFEVVTLYPEFFDVPVDDRERAAVLLHETCHLMGDGEDAALQSTWHNKQRLGWTTDKYKETRVWDATEKLTKARFPYMFQCGSDGKSDCF
jgi:NADH:ubiquinone oxidoreductase subunit E